MRPPAPASVRERLRLRPWLEQQIQSGRYPGVHWLDRSAGVFQIPWKHAARHGWSIDRDASLFRSWAMYTGKYIPDRDKPDPKTWKANFRCALNSLSDVRELSEQSLKKGSLASRVYMLLPSRAKGRRRRGLSSGLSLSAQGWEAAVKVHPDPQSSSCVPLDRIPDMFFRSRGFQEDSGPFHARTRERLPPYSIIKQEEATTEEQISSYCSSSTTEEQISSYCSSSTTEEQISSYCSSSTTEEQISSYCSSSTTEEQISSYCSSSTTEEQICSYCSSSTTEEQISSYCSSSTTDEQISSYCSSSATEEQISSSFHLLSKGFSCAPQTQRTWDSPSAQPEQAEAVLKIVDQLSCSDVWGQSEEPRYWRPSGSFWEDGFSGDLDPLISAPCPLQMDSYWPSPSLSVSVEPCTPGLSQ